MEKRLGLGGLGRLGHGLELRIGCRHLRACVKDSASVMKTIGISGVEISASYPESVRGCVYYLLLQLCTHESNEASEVLLRKPLSTIVQ